MTERDADEPAASADEEEILRLVDAAMQAHFEGGEAGLEQFCRTLDRHREIVQKRLLALRRVGLLGDVPGAVNAGGESFPERLGEFELIEPLGRGGMGIVYRARQLTLEREVAVKLIRPEQLLFPGVRERFQREIEIVARLQNDGVVRLYSFGEDRGIPWFAMELIRGASLAQVMEAMEKQRDRALTGADLVACLPSAGPEALSVPLFAGEWADVALRLVERVALALDDAHRQGVLHRDIKPSNVMLTASGRVVLLDFGLAWSHGADRLTRSGAELGTIHYMAPEQLAGAAARVDERTDVYSLGVVLRELITLRSVFTGSTVDEVARQVREGVHAPFGGSRSSIARDIETVCLVAMDRDPQRRYASARLFARDLRHVLERRPIEAVRPGLGLRLRRLAQRNRALSVAIAIAGIAILLTPLAVAVHERELRRELEATNRTLAGEVARADNNLGLAIEGIQEMVTRLDEERLSTVPDLRAFVRGALANSAAFLEGLATGNPADPAARLGLAQNLARVAFVQWLHFEVAPSEPLFLRTLQLLEGVGDADEARQLELEVRMALIHVQRLTPEAAIVVYRAAFARAGAEERRSPKLQRLAARCLDRMSVELKRRNDPEYLPTVLTAVRLREAVVAAAPGVEAWNELSVSLITLAQECERAGDEAGRARWVARLDQAIAAVGQLSDSLSMEQRDRFVSVLLARANALRCEPERRIEIFERLERVQFQSFERRPSRVSEVLNWVEGAWQLVTAYELAGRLPPAFAKAQEALQIVRAAERIWAHDFGVMRYAMSARRELAQLAIRHAQPGIDVDALLDEAAAIAPRAESVQSRRRTTIEECGRVFTERGRRRVLAGNGEAALADASEAVRYFALAAERAEIDRSRSADYLAPRLLQVEALLRLGRDDEALALLHGCAPLPKDVLEQVPTLAMRGSDPRFAAIVEAARSAR